MKVNHLLSMNQHPQRKEMILKSSERFADNVRFLISAHSFSV